VLFHPPDPGSGSGRKKVGIRIRDKISRIRNTAPNLLLLAGADEQEQAASLNSLWNDDLVHLVLPGKFEVLVTALVERSVTESFTNAHQHSPNSNRVPSHHQRQSWVVNDDTNAHRDYGYHVRGRGSGGGRRGRGRGVAGVWSGPSEEEVVRSRY
jgi:hypothetical protein